MNSLTCAALLSRYRQRADLSMNELGRLTHYDHSYLSRLESGQRVPSRTAVQVIGAVLKLSPAEYDDFLVAAGHVPAWLPRGAQLAALRLVARHPDAVADTLAALGITPTEDTRVAS